MENNENELVRQAVLCIRSGIASLDFMKKNGLSKIYGMSNFSAEDVRSVEDKILAELNQQGRELFGDDFQDIEL